MAADVGMDWDALLQQSEELAAGDSSAAAAAFPRVERDLLQVEAYASALRQRLSSRADGGGGRGDAAAAARLLAHEGVNTRKLTRALQHFELRPSHEDAAALASEASTVEEFVSRAHEAAVVAAIAQAQQDAAAAADSFLDSAEERGWGAAKGALFGLAASVAAAANAAANGDGSVGAALALPAASPPPPGRGGGNAQQLLLPARTRLYSRVVAEMNEAAAAGKGFDAVGAFGRAAAEAAAASSSSSGGAAAAAAAARGGAPPPPPPGLRMLWDILARQAAALASPASRALGEAAAARRAAEGGGGASAAAASAAEAAAAAALVLGGRRYLSECFVSHVEATVRRNRAAAALGGSPSREALLRAYLRVKEGLGGGAGGSEAAQQLALDFDSPGGADTRWQRLYFSLRAGFAEEARAAAVAIAGPNAPASVAEAGLLEGGTGAGGMGGARPLSGLDALPCAVEAWLSGGGGEASSSSLASSPAVPAAAASALAAEAERTLRAAGVGIGGSGGVSAGSRNPWLSPGFRARAGVLALLSSDARCAAAVAREGSALLPTIEDFLWFHGGLVRVDASLAAAVTAAKAGGASSEGGGAAAAASAAASAAAAAAAASSVADAYSLPTLQSHISRFGAAHFSAGGRDPFLYAAVLLLSAQPKAAVAFLAKDPLARGSGTSDGGSGGGRSDAPHLAAALSASRLLEGGGPGDAGASAGAAASPAPLLRAWGRSLAAVDPSAALEYYVAAAAAGGGSLALRAALLRELLLASSAGPGSGGGGAFGRLLGGGGVGAAARADGGPLARFAGPGGGPAERAALLAAVGAGCEAAGEVDWAAELYAASGSPGDALRLLCGALGDALGGGAGGGDAGGELLERIVIRGNDAAAALAAAPADADPSSSSSPFAVLDLWRQLLAARDLLAAASRGDAVSALRALDSLPCIPQDAHRVQRCADSLPALPAPLARLLTPLLVAGGRAAAEARDRERLRAMASFAAAAAPTRVARAAFEELNGLHDRLNLPT